MQTIHGSTHPYVVRLQADEVQAEELVQIWEDTDEHVKCQRVCIATEEAAIRTAVDNGELSEITTAIGQAFDVDEELVRMAKEVQMSLLMADVERMRRGGGHAMNPQE